MSSINQVVILAGGKGTRMGEMTSSTPKPMVEIGGKPVLVHLMEIFDSFDNFEYLICTGYLGDIIENYFSEYSNVMTIHTGDETPTGGRIKKIEKYLNENFIVTYGDGLANVNIDKLIDFHIKHEKIGTITVTNPESRFGLVEFNDTNKVTSFIEKPTLQGHVNMGFMVFNKKFISYIDELSTLESKPIENLANDGELYAYEHLGFFKPMDTYREYLMFNNLWESNEKPWLNFND